MNPDEKICVYCGETIKSVARVCKHCKSNLIEPASTKETVTEVQKIVDLPSKGNNIFTTIWKYSKYVVPVLAIALLFLNHTENGNEVIKYLKANHTTNSSSQNVETLIATEIKLDALCRGGSGDDPKTFKACEARQDISKKLNKLGWCYGKNNEASYLWSWHKCVGNSRPY